ncbi:MAG: phosphate signaling complex protein PhoU [Neomegalonema sp.]|nr:phosphate signaling complex protein PhoU [Neomegalonema sp.]
MDFTTLRARVSEMGGLVEEQFADCLEAAQRRDLVLAAEIVARDQGIDQREVEIEELAVRTLALRQPLAQDLRETIAALKIAATLERIGDLAKNIAKRTSLIHSRSDSNGVASILRLGHQVRGQLADALDAYGTRDIHGAEGVWRRDIEVDELHNSIFHVLIANMSSEPRFVSEGAQLLFVAKNLERIGDHTTFIAEMTYYVAVGRSFGNDRPKGDPLFPLPNIDTIV